MTLTGEFGRFPGHIVFSAGESTETTAEVRSWSASQVIVAVPTLGWGSWAVSAPGGCVLSGTPQFQVTPPPRIYVDNNVNAEDGFDTITTMAYDPASGALTQLGPPTSTGMPASGRPGCSRSLAIAGARLFAAGNTGVAVFEIEPATGALRRTSNGAEFLPGSTDGAAPTWTIGAYLWTATSAGIVAWRFDTAGHLVNPARVSTAPATATTVVGGRPSRIYATRGDGTFDAWSVAYQRDSLGGIPLPVLTPLAGSPFGERVASPLPSPSGIAIRSVRDGNDLLYLPTTAGLGLWSLDATGVPTEVDGSPFALNPPSGTLSTPLFAGPRSARRIYLAGIGSGYIAAAALDPAGVPSPLPDSPWNFAPDLTNISCTTLVAGPTAERLRLIASDAGNRRIGVFDVPATSAMPVPVAGSPFVMTETPSDLASGIAVLGGP